MHLLTLGAFWPKAWPEREASSFRRNAPSGARCFLAERTRMNAHDIAVVMHLLALGAFWPEEGQLLRAEEAVVMHLLALSAFWHAVWDTGREGEGLGRNAPSGARCFLAPSPRPASLQRDPGAARHRRRKHLPEPSSTSSIEPLFAATTPIATDPHHTPPSHRLPTRLRR